MRYVQEVLFTSAALDVLPGVPWYIARLEGTREEIPSVRNLVHVK